MQIESEHGPILTLTCHINPYMEPGCILKVNMVNPGRSCAIKYTVEEIAEANVQVLTCNTIIL